MTSGTIVGGDAKRTDSPIEREVQTIAKANAELHDVIRQLASRLESVLSPEPPQPSSGRSGTSVSPNSGNASMTGRLGEAVNTINEARGYLQSMLNRLEL